MGTWIERLRAWWRSLVDQHPDVLERLHLLSVRSDAETEAGDVGRGYDLASADFGENVWVSKAVRVWADSLAPLRLGIREPHGGGLSFDHPLAQLLANPNPDMTASDVWRQWATDMALGGECGFEFARDSRGRLAAFYPRQPSEFAVRPDPAFLRYRRVLAYIIGPDTPTGYVLTPAEFKHFKFYNPLNVWRGLAPLSAVRLGVVIDQLVQSWSRLFFLNSARPDYAVIAPEGLTSSERDELEFKLSTKFGGVVNTGRPIILEKGVQDVKVFSFPRRDLEWLQQRRMARDEIGAAFGVPDEIMGYGRDTYENFDTAERVLWALTLTNLIHFRDEQLTHWLLGAGALAAGERVETDLSRVWALRRAAAQQMQDAKALFGMGVPFNTIDVYLGLGVGPVAGGDVGHPFGSSGTSGASGAASGGGGRAPGPGSSETERSSIPALQARELVELRRLRSHRRLGRGQTEIDAVRDVTESDELRGVLAAGELAGESRLELEDRLIAWYRIQKAGG